MNIGTKSLLFGVHQFILHPLQVLLAWLVYYKRFPKLYQLCAIVTHDWGYWGSPNMDGQEGSNHPERAANMWRVFYSKFGRKVAKEIEGHSGSYASKHYFSVSKLFYADKLCTVFIPCYLYVILGSLSGEIYEYMGISNSKRKDLYYTDKRFSKARMADKIKWFFQTTGKIIERVYDE